MANGLIAVRKGYMRPQDRPKSLIYQLNEFIKECRINEINGTVYNASNNPTVKWHLGNTYWWYSNRTGEFVGLKSYDQTPHKPDSFNTDWLYVCKSLNGKLMIACGDVFE